MGCINSKHGGSVAAASPVHQYAATENGASFVFPTNSSSSAKYLSGRFEVDEKSEHTKKSCRDSRCLKKGSSNGTSGRFSIKLGFSHRHVEAEQVAAGWPAWLSEAAGDAVHGWVPLRADAFEKLEKIGQGTYSSVFKAREVETGRLVALKKVRFDNFQTESIRFMAREISILRRLDHPNIMRLNGVITSRLSSTIYLVFEYMEHDLAGLTSSPDIKFTQAQIKCYMKQLLCGVEHCHLLGVMHRDIKTSNILVNNQGVLKLGDFGLANMLTPKNKQRLTSRVVTLWYRPPELLMGSTNYGVSVDLWSVGCVFAELLTGKPILKGRTEVEQLHKVFKLCGSPSEEFWKKHRLPQVAMFKPQNFYESCLQERFRGTSPSAMALLETLLSVEPHKRGTASSALLSEYFRTQPYPCDPSSLPKYPPNKEIDARYREDLRRRKASAGAQNPDSSRKRRSRRSSHGSINLSRAEFKEETQDNGQYSNRHSVLTANNHKDRVQHSPTSELSQATSITQGDVYRGPPQVPGSSSFAWAKKRYHDATFTLYSNEPCSRSQVSAVDSSSLTFLQNTFNLPRTQNGNAQEGICTASRQHQAQEELSQRHSRRASYSYMMPCYDRDAMEEGKDSTSGPTWSQLRKFDEHLLQRNVNHVGPPDWQIKGR